MKVKILALLGVLALLLTGCGSYDNHGGAGANVPGEAADLGGDGSTFGESLDSLGAYDGYFEEQRADVTIECISGTPGAYKLEGTTLTFTGIDETSVYSVSGSFSGNIVVDVGDDYRFDLELHGLSLVCSTTNPIMVTSGKDVSIKAKKDTENYIYDTRPAIDDADKALHAGAIRSEVDLEIGGKGTLFVISENNNGIHTKNDLNVKNLTLLVACVDNALKGNDSVEIKDGNTTLIAAGGDCIKTKNSDISAKGNQRGTVSIVGGSHDLYAACDGIDAAYDVNIDDNDTVLNIYTDQYSNYSSAVAATSTQANYIRFTSKEYHYAVKYYNDETDYVWVNAEYHSAVSGTRNKYYYYSYPKMPEYAHVQFFIYEKASQRGQDVEYLVMSDYLTQNTACDTFALTQSHHGLSYQWTNYTTVIQEGGFGGPGGMRGGNTDKGDHSAKGIKAANEIVIQSGTINIKAYDDAIHASRGGSLENDKQPLGNVTVSGGVLTICSNDDGLHADGAFSITAGSINVTSSYEGIEGETVSISGGAVSVIAKDDGLNATATEGEAITISGGSIYIYCTGDGIDSNSRTAYSGIVFSGGRTVIISNSNGNCAIDTEQGYRYTEGAVIAIMSRGGMSNEATRCQNFSSVGKSASASVTRGEYLVVGVGDTTPTIEMPVSMSALVMVLGDNAPSITSEASTTKTLDKNGVAWY